METILKKQPTLKGRFFDLWKGNDSPHEIALGVAIGVFIGITPLYGFHMIMVLITAFTMRRLNKMAIFLGTNISLPVTIPFITWVGYSIGQKILGKNAYSPLDWKDFKHFSYDTFFHLFYVLLVGSFVLGVMLSVLFYYLTLWFLKRKSNECR